MELDPSHPAPRAVAMMVAGIDPSTKDLTLAEDTDLHNETLHLEEEAHKAVLRQEAEARDKLLREEQERKIQEARVGFLAELEERVKRLHVEGLHRAKTDHVPFESFFLNYGDLRERFPVLNYAAVVDMFLACQAANGFDIITTIHVNGNGGSYGDRGAKFEWKGRNSKARVFYVDDGSSCWASAE